MRVLGLLMVLAGVTLAVAASAADPPRPKGEPATCRHQSGASFPKAFKLKRNRVVGPLAFVGGAAFTDAETVRRFGGNKYPLLLRSGHRVTVEITRATGRAVALGYSNRMKRLPDGERHVADGDRVVRFIACPQGHGISDVDGRPVTFWSGFVLASAPRCVRMRVWVDDEPRPRTAQIELGQRCG
jgi:hypothetical protein